MLKSEMSDITEEIFKLLKSALCVKMLPFFFFFGRRYKIFILHPTLEFVKV